MFHPDIFHFYVYRLTECRTHAVDACNDTAEFYNIDIRSVAQFLRSIEAIDANRLTLI